MLLVAVATALSRTIRFQSSHIECLGGCTNDRVDRRSDSYRAKPNHGIDKIPRYQTNGGNPPRLARAHFGPGFKRAIVQVRHTWYFLNAVL